MGIMQDCLSDWSCCKLLRLGRKNSEILPDRGNQDKVRSPFQRQKQRASPASGSSPTTHDAKDPTSLDGLSRRRQDMGHRSLDKVLRLESPEWSAPWRGNARGKRPDAFFASDDGYCANLLNAIEGREPEPTSELSGESPVVVILGRAGDAPYGSCRHAFFH
jgi:hypothetical protein